MNIPLVDAAPRADRRHSARLPVALALAAAACLHAAGTAFAQTPYAQGPLLDIVQNMPEGSWTRVNANSFSDVWTPASLRPLYASGNPTPSKIIASWSSFAWDSNRGDLILYGGGHANYSGNDVYRWRSRSLKWERAALPSQITYIGSNAYTAIDGADAAPTSAHTYDNAVFLPLVDRYMNFGGALYNTGGAYVRPSESDPAVLRQTGPYLFNPDLSDPMKVGGTTGSHVQRVAPYPEVVGGNMWQNRDIPKHLAGLALPRSHVNGCTAYSYESDDYDVVYVAARSGGGTALDLYRYQLTDVAAPWLDQVTKVGVYWSSPSAQTTCAYDPVSNIVLRTGSNTSPFFFWDLATPGASNREKRVSVAGSVASFVEGLDAIGRSISYCAMDYDPLRENFVVWCGAGSVWRVTPPSPLSIYGWEVTAQPTPAGEVPPNKVGTGILGKWDYVEGFDVFVGLEDSTLGNIWIYKPVGWQAPGSGGGGGGGDPPANQSPIVGVTAPADGSTATVGNAVALAASASDPDGTIAQVSFRVNGQIVGITNVTPYSASWTPAATGSFAITAEATDNKGAATLSSAVNVTVGAANQLPAVSLTAPADGSSATIGQPVALAASASDPDGSVAKVVFRANGEVVGTVTTAPYSTSWTPAAAGSVAITAEATDNKGATTTSGTANVTVSAPEGQTTSVLQRQDAGYQGSADLYLSNYHRTTNFGASSLIDFDRSNYVPLVRFAVLASEGGPVPAGAVVESAKLYLHKGSYDNVIALHAMLRPWTESGATWNRPLVGGTWAVPGAGGADTDYNATPDAQANAAWSAGWVEFDVTARIQSFVAGTPNNGWRLMSVSGNSNRKQFKSSEYATDTSLRPKLEIVWHAAP